MPRVVELPPTSEPRSDGSIVGGWWRDVEGGDRILCELCPRACHLKPGDRGFCFVRENRGGELLLTTYGRSTGFCIDPIEKKPLNHFYPGTSVLSFGTAGCNLGCKFCQNWDISKSREVERLSERATPETIAEAARRLECHSVAFTYNDPIIWAEYAIDTARQCRAVDVKTVAVTAGYISPKARAPFFEFIDAANVDLKAFTEEFYFKLTYSHLQPVLETLQWLHEETDVWFEITNLIIPDANDSPDELRRLCDWILQHVGDERPVHFTAFHPDFRMKDRPSTPHETLLEAYRIAREQGVKYAYVGNVNDQRHQSTYCPSCGGMLIERNWYELGAYNLKMDRCGHCDAPIAGRFHARPGDWGRKRLPIKISEFAPPTIPNLVTLESESKMATERSTASPGGDVAVRPDLSPAQERAVHYAACEVMAASIKKRQVELPDAALADAASSMVMGAFVTLKRKGRLRACCGTLGKPMPLGEAVANAARRTATEDVRLPPISPTELPHLDVDVTLLYAFEPFPSTGADRVNDVTVGEHGLQIQMGANAGLLLPSVAVEQGYDAEQFLEQVCRKASLPMTCWKNEHARLVRFQGRSIPGVFDADVLGKDDGRPAEPAVSVQDLTNLAAHCRTNLLLLRQGGTPSYYLSNATDANVQGLAMKLTAPELEEPLTIGNISLRKPMPLQSTLFNLCDSMAKGLAGHTLSESELKVDLAVLFDSAMHGVIAEPDLTGFDARQRSLMVSESGRTSWKFDPSLEAAQLLAETAEDAQVRSPQNAAIYSFATIGVGETDLKFNNVPKPHPGDEVRQPAVAGAFYPNDPSELQAMVEEMIDRDEYERSVPCAAVMTPHAGLAYSGRVAGGVFSRVKVPETVIVIGPKHTRLGVEWAVAPHRVWRMPGGDVAADPELARKLTEAIPGLQLDAAAHLREHAIEVELPFLRALAPEARVVGIALAGGSVELAREFGAAMAGVIREMDPAPLLVISSDMNHYGTDEVNRRLDEMALKAMESLDSTELFETCTRHNISMCGVFPAICVLETLRALGRLQNATRAGYATSADVSGDMQRVVGYAGMLLN